MKLKFLPLSEKAKYFASRLPSNWPSYLHNKCSVPTCYFPNSPQVAYGTYNCQGHHCEGTYYVSPSTAESVMKNHRKQMKMREDRARWDALMDAEVERQKVVQRQLDVEGMVFAAEELAAKYEERRRNQDTSTGFTSTDLPFSSYLARRAAQRRRSTDTKLRDLIAKQQHHTSSTSDLVHHQTSCTPAVNSYCKVPVDLNHLPQMPSQTSPRSHGSKSKYPSEYNSPQYRHTETQAHNYQHGKSPSKF